MELHGCIAHIYILVTDCASHYHHHIGSMNSYLLLGGGPLTNSDYRKASNISRTIVGNKIVDHSDVVGASPVGAAPTTSSFSS